MPMDKQIQTSLHGRKLGLTKDGSLVGEERVIALAGDRMADRIVWQDDFLGDAIATQYNFQEGVDAATSDFAILAGGIGGKARLTTGDAAGVDFANNGVQVDLGILNWQASNGGLSFETIVELSANTLVALFIGFTDTAAFEMPWTLSGTTFTSTQTDGFGFLFDTAATTDTIRCVAVKADVDKTSVDTADVFTAATVYKFRCELVVNPANSALWDAVFYINNVRVGYISDAITAGTDLTPVIAAFSRTTATRTLDIDFWRTAMDR
jgi:hypothetical protein